MPRLRTVKKMINSGDVESGHNLSPEELCKLADGKVLLESDLLSRILYTLNCCFISSLSFEPYAGTLYRNSNPTFHFRTIFLLVANST